MAPALLASAYGPFRHSLPQIPETSLRRRTLQPCARLTAAGPRRTGVQRRRTSQNRCAVAGRPDRRRRGRRRLPDRHRAEALHRARRDLLDRTTAGLAMTRVTAPGLAGAVG